MLKVNDEVKQTAATITADAKTDDEKLQKLFEFCRTKIKNTSDDASGLTAEDRKKLKENKTPGDTLKRGSGTMADIDLLFAALAIASGYDARIVLAPDRGDLFFDRGLPNSYFLEPSNIAVRVGESWKFFNPGLNYVPIGMLRWQEEGVESLITDPKQPAWVTSPVSAPEKSLIKRKATFTLAEDGTLEGDVEVEYTGHAGMEKKEDLDEESATEREDSLKEDVKAQLSTAELSKIRVENVTDYSTPFVFAYHIKIPGYAQKTGKRLFLQPAVFQHGIEPMFSSSGRKYPVYFHYPWMELDEITINLPAGFSLDNADAPAPFSGGQISEYKPSLKVTKDGRTLFYTREFVFGKGGNILFPVESYSALKTYFDVVNKQDNHTVTLKQTPASASATSN